MGVSCSILWMTGGFFFHPLVVLEMPKYSSLVSYLHLFFWRQSMCPFCGNLWLQRYVNASDFRSKTAVLLKRCASKWVPWDVFAQNKNQSEQNRPKAKTTPLQKCFTFFCTFNKRVLPCFPENKTESYINFCSKKPH